MLPNSFYEVHVTLILKPDKHTTPVVYPKVTLSGSNGKFQFNNFSRYNNKMV